MKHLVPMLLLWLAFKSCACSETTVPGNATDTTSLMSAISSQPTTSMKQSIGPSIPPNPGPNGFNSQCALKCFRGTQGSFCATKPEKPPTEGCADRWDDILNGTTWTQVRMVTYCVLYRFKCTQESTCYPGSSPNFYIGNDWAYTADLCDEYVRVMGKSGYETGSCSSEDVKRGTIKWVTLWVLERDLPYYNLKGQKVQSENCSSDAEVCLCSSNFCNTPSALELSDSTDNNCAYALKDYPRRSTPAPAVTINNYITVIVVIIQFKAPYQLSELTPDLQNKMATAVANVIGVNASSVSLSFVEIDLRRRLLQQQRGVLVNVGLKDFQGSTAGYASKLTQDAINTQMSKLGLRSVTSVQAVNATQAPSVKSANLALRTPLSGATAAFFAALTASLLMAARAT